MWLLCRYSFVLLRYTKVISSNLIAPDSSGSWQASISGHLPLLSGNAEVFTWESSPLLPRAYRCILNVNSLADSRHQLGSQITLRE